jgi:predicted O-linked N-acetylglucosamine transferase (SPINDLY family)
MFKRLLGSLFASSPPPATRAATAQDVDYFLQGALAAQKSGDMAAAERLLREGLAAYPASVIAYVMLAELLRKAGRDAEARPLYESALAQETQSPEVRFNYAVVLSRLNAYAAAERVFRSVIEQRPEWVAPRVNAGFAAQRRGENAAALLLFEGAIALSPATASGHAGAGLALMNLDRPHEAVGHLQRALELDPVAGGAFQNLCAVQYKLGDEESLRKTLAEHSATAKSVDGAAIARVLALPSLLDSREEIQQVRARMQQEIEALSGRPLSVDDPAADVGVTSFNLAYQGEDDRDLHQRIAALHLHACPGLQFVAPHCSGWRAREGGPLRVGIASTFLHDHSIGRVMRGLFAQFDRARVFVHGFAFNARDDAVYRAMQGDADQWTVLTRDYRSARDAIANARLDVLLYPDIGMDPLTYFLAFARLAPVQCTTWGHPVTSGVPALDYFISTDSFETADSDGQYSERLVRLADVAFPGYYQRSPATVETAQPAPGFDRGRRVYFCPQVLFKLHPDFDAILADILRRDAGGEIVITHKGAYDSFRLRRLQARLQRAAPDVFDRFVFLPRTPDAAGYRQRLRDCHVVLDTVHYCGGNTSLEAIASGAPVVTLPSALQRGRHTYGFFRKMRFTETVVQSADEYAALAVRIATDRALAQHLRETQLARAAALYEDAGAVRQLEDFFERAIAGVGAG